MQELISFHNPECSLWQTFVIEHKKERKCNKKFKFSEMFLKQIVPSTLNWKKSKKDTICKFVYIFSLLRQMFWTVLIIYLEDKMWKVLHKLNWSNISHSLTSQLPENGSVFLSQPHSAQSWSWAQSCEHGQLFYFPHRSRQWENSLSASVTKENKNTQLIFI